MAVRKSAVYFFVLLVIATWFILIIWLSYKDDRLFTPITYESFKHATPAEFDLYSQLNPRPGMPPPAPNTAIALVVTLKNKAGEKFQSMLVPADEFSCLRVQIFPVGATKPTFDQLMGQMATPDANEPANRTHTPTWHTLMIGPHQSIGKEIVLPQRVFPTPGDYRIVLHWQSDDRTRLEGNVAPIDRTSLILDLQTEQTVRVTPPHLPKPESQMPPSETAPPRG
ncbi:MAG TPA: hypothetical protein VL860_10340 [Planctomycetota bacterium]|nr:hypothetical protein [Planctomycetota bacterium]